MVKLLNINELSDSQYHHYYRLMTDKKKDRVDRFRFEDDKKRSVGGELLARQMIAAQCGMAEAAIRFDADDNGKPFAENAPVHFNISHSGDYVLCAVSRSPVGADIEKMRPVEDKLLRYVCTADELSYVLAAADETDRQRRFFRVWTAKEAYFKCRGTGITEVKSVSVLDAAIAAKTESYYHGDYAVSIYTE